VGKGGGQVEVTEYTMSDHFGICVGPIDAMTRVVVKEKTAWTGRITGLESFAIDLPDLFGGVKKEGGVGGVVTFLPGAADQILPDWLAQKLGRADGTDCPGFRGLASAFFTGGQGSPEMGGVVAKGGARRGSQTGFYWTANNPYLPGVWITVERTPVGLTAGLAMVGTSGESAVGQVGDWRYKSVSTSDPADYSGAAYDDSAWSTGPQPFADTGWSGGSIGTAVPKEQDLWLRGTFGASVTGIRFFVDDYAEAWYNGAPLTLTRESFGEGLTGIYSATFPTPGAENILAIRVNDTSTGDENHITFQVVNSDGEQAEIPFTPGMDANPAHIIYECLTNTDWGMGSPSTAIDVDSFEDAAQTLYVENFGLSMIWTRQASIEKFVQEVLDHIQAVLFVDPATGLLTLSLIRGDYTAETIVLEEAFSFNANEAATTPEASAGTYTISGVSADDEIHITFPTGGLYKAWSRWLGYDPADGTGDGYYTGSGSDPLWWWSFSVKNAAGSITKYDDTGAIGSAMTEDAAFAAAQAADPIILTGSTSYQLWLVDDILFNRGGLTMRIERHRAATTLPDINPDNADLSSFSRKLWGEIVNEITVTWTNPQNEQEETITVQDLASIATQGGTISDSRNYYGVRNATLAQELGWRDLRSAGQPLASCQAEVDRTLWQLRPASVVTVTWPEYGIDAVVFRVTSIDYGKPGDPTIKLDLIEDVFGADIGEYESPPSSEWTDPSAYPVPIETVEIFTLPLFVALASPAAEFVTSPEYPEVVAGVLATTDADDTFDYELWDEFTLPNGSTEWRKIGDMNLIGRAELGDALALEATSTAVTFGAITGRTFPTVGGFVIIGEDGEDGNEIAMIDAADYDTGEYTLTRGVLDTVPRAWADATPVWFVDGSTLFEDSTVRSSGEVADYKLRTRTSRGLLALESADLEAYTLTDRPWMPNRPADVQAYGEAWSSQTALIDATARPDPWVPVTWANRNRLLEDSQVLAWTDGDVTPETGQTTRIEVLAIDGTPLATHDGLTGTDFDVPDASFAGEAVVRLQVSADRSDADGDFASLQFFEHWVRTGSGARLTETGDRRLTETGGLRVTED
jgi:hypothetical protein